MPSELGTKTGGAGVRLPLLEQRLINPRRACVGNLSLNLDGR